MSFSEELYNDIKAGEKLCETHLQAHYEENLSKLAPGESAPQDNCFYSAVAKDAYIAEGNAYSARILSKVDAKIKSAGTSAASAPTTEAVNTVTMLSLNKQATKADYELAMENYGNNAITAKTIASLAKDAGYIINSPNTDVAKYLGMLDARQQIESLLNPRDIISRMETNMRGTVDFAFSLGDYSIFD